MIVSIRHKGLKQLYEADDRRKLPQERVDKIARILARLDQISDVGEMDAPGLRLHPLKGNLAGFWSVNVSGNWRITFRFSDGHVHDVDLIDYH